MDLVKLEDDIVVLEILDRPWEKFSGVDLEITWTRAWKTQPFVPNELDIEADILVILITDVLGLRPRMEGSIMS